MALLLIFFKLMLVSCMHGEQVMHVDQVMINIQSMRNGYAGICQSVPTYRACVDLEDEAILVGEECCSTEGGAVGVNLDSQGSHKS